MILIDSSQWISFLRNDAYADRLRDVLVNRPKVACSEPVLMEVVAGARNAEEHARLRSLLRSREWLPVDSVVDFDAAARIYAQARARGITPGGHIDCMIVGIALRNRVSLMTRDRQQAEIARLVGVDLVT